MTFKKLRYNLLMFGLIALVIAYLGMSIFLSTPTQTGDNQASDTDIGADIIPSEPEDPGMDEEPAPDVKIPAKGIALVVYALDLLNNGPGYVSTYSQSLSNVAKGFDIKVTQNIAGKISKGVNSKGEKVAIEELFYYADNVPSVAAGQVANYFRGCYTNFDNGTTQIGISNDYNLQNQTFNLQGQSDRTVTTAQAIDEYKILESLGYPVDINTRSVELALDRVDPDNKSFRVIKLRLRNMSFLSENFKANYGSSGAMTNINFTSVEFEFRINIKNGYINSIKRDETFTAKAAGFDVSSEAHTVQKFSSMNKAASLRDSL